MEGRIDEGKITGAIDAISLKNIVKITEKMKFSKFNFFFKYNLN